MTENENLIAVARTWTASECAASPVGAFQTIAYLANQLEAAEKAHTPTDNEREALGVLIRDIYRKNGYYAPDQVVADAVLAAGFRRSEVPEPSETVAALERQIQKLDADLGQEIDRREELHDIADRLSWAIAPVSEIGEHSSANDPWENAIEYAESRVWAEPQGEPSDLIQRLIDLRGDMRHNADEVATLDAAITALRAQGEPSDARGIVGRALMGEARMDTFSAWNLADDIVAALRAAGEVTR